MFSLVCSLMLATVGAEAPRAADTVVVCPQVFENALAPWLDYRRGQGHTIAVVPAEENAAKIKARLHEAYQAEPKLSILLVGDVEKRIPFDPAARSVAVPTHYAAAKINVLFGSEPTIATDNWYADFDDDGVPEAAIGRLPVDSAAELTGLIKRIIAYERSTDFGLWRRKINFIAGMGGFGFLADAAIESAAKSLLLTYLPPEYESTMTYASWRSPYFPGGEQFHETTVRRFNEGCLMWVYIGHGGVRELDRFQTPDDKVHHIFDVRDVGKLQSRQPPIALFLSCYSAAFDAREDCLGEEMLRAEGGPIAVLGGSRVTMPYAMSILGQELMTAFFKDRAPTIGQLMLGAKRNVALKPRTSDADKMFDVVAAAMMPMAADLKAQRLEHLQLFNLLGDPLLRLKHPEPIAVRTPTEVDESFWKPESVMPLKIDESGSAEIVEQMPPPATPLERPLPRLFNIVTPVVGKLQFQVTPRRDQLLYPIAERAKYDPLFDYQAEYDRNVTDPFLQKNEGFPPLKRYEVTLGTPPRGDYYIRAYVEGNDAFAVGAASVKVVPAKPKAAAVETAAKPKVP